MDISWLKLRSWNKKNITMIKDGDEGEHSDSGSENTFSFSRADNVCFHPGVMFFVDETQGQKCLCCLIG